MENSNSGNLKSLPKSDLILLLDLIQKSLSCNSADHIQELATMLNKLFSFDYHIFSLFKTDEEGGVKTVNTISVSYPYEWIEMYLLNKWQKVDPIIRETFKTWRLNYWADIFSKYDVPGEMIPISNDFGIREGYSHGVKTDGKNESSLFCFCGDSLNREKRIETILEIFIPHLFQALRRVASGDNHRMKITLSSRELEILKWVRQGKSTWDISEIFGISQRTVKFHLSNIMKKMDAMNRPHAVAIAIEQGLIDIE